jgi:LPS-assembly protein
MGSGFAARSVAAIILLLSLAAPFRATAAEPASGRKDDVVASELGKLGAGLKALTLPGADGQKLPVLLDADRMTFDEETGVAAAEGHVVVTMGSRTVTADKIRYDSRTQEAELVGSVRFKSEGDEFSFDRIVMNIDTEQGILYNGSIHLETNNYRVSGERIEKTGARSFFLRKGSITTCDCDPIPDWKLDVGRARVTIDGYAVGKDVTLKLRDIPVLWMPWGAFPVKLTRQSGFLLPAYIHSRTIGNGVSLPWYQVINRWSDATLTFDYMDKRGFRTEGEYRFVPNKASEGNVRGAFLHDRETGADLSRLYGSNLYRDGKWTANGRWDIASDAVYYRDFVEADLLRTGRHAVSRGFVEQSDESSVVSLSATWAKDIQQLPGVDNTVQRIPELSMTVMPGRVGGPGLGIDAWGSGSGSWFYRRGGEREGRFHGLAELSRTFTLYPSVFLTPVAGVDVLQSVRSGERTNPDEEGGGRVVPMGGVQLSATVWRYFNPSGGTIVHSVNPAIRYQWVPTVNQNDIPVTDQWSRVQARSEATVSVSQGLHRLDSTGTPVELASLDVEWAFDIGNRKAPDSPYVDPLAPYVWTLRDQIDLNAGRTRDTHNASDVLARLRVNPAARWTAIGEALYDPNEQRLTSTAVGGEWHADAEHKASVNYRVSRQLSEDILGAFAWRLGRVVGLTGSINYSIRNKEMTEGAATVNLYPRSDCWNVGFMVRRTALPADTSIRFVFGLKGLGGVGK